jgi:hypothetical protein
MQLSQLTLEPHNSCYTYWVQVVYPHLPSPLFCSLWNIFDCCSEPGDWRTTSADSTIYRRCLPVDVPVAPCPSCIYSTLPHSLNWFLIQLYCRYSFITYMHLFRDTCCDILMILLYICVTWSWRIYDCSIYVLINRLWQNWYQSRVDCRTKPR